MSAENEALARATEAEFRIEIAKLVIRGPLTEPITERARAALEALDGYGAAYIDARRARSKEKAQ